MAELYTINNRVRSYNGIVRVRPEPLTMQVQSQTFPSFYQNTSSSSKNGWCMRLQFNVPVLVTIDYGDGTKISKVAALEGNIYSIWISTNAYYDGDAGFFAPYTYSTGDSNSLRTVSIEYPKGNLISLSVTNTVFEYNQDFNFIFYLHRKLQNFTFNEAIVNNLNLQSLTDNTNPDFLFLSYSCFSSDSDYYRKIPTDGNNLTVKTLRVGTPGWDSSIIDINSTNLQTLVGTTLGNSLTRIAINAQSYSLGLPSNWDGLPNVNGLEIAAAFNVFPPVIFSMPSLNDISIGSANTITTWDGNIFTNISNFYRFDSYNANTYLYGLPINIHLAVDSLYMIRFFNAAIDNQTKADSLITEIYNLIVDYTDTDAIGSDGFRGMLIVLTVGSSFNGGITPLGGLIRQPTGYVTNVSNGTIEDTGHMIYVLQNQYGCSVSYSGTWT